jgi:hypothetical protein
MTIQPTTPKRFRPRFSLRTLVILVMLVCCYASTVGCRTSTPPVVPLAVPEVPEQMESPGDSMAILSPVTLLCVYAACWGPTKTQGVQDVKWHTGLAHWFDREDGVETVSALLPLIVSADQRQTILTIFPRDSGPHPDSIRIEFRRHYYFWFFGYVAKLPFERVLWVSTAWPDSQRGKYRW